MTVKNRAGRAWIFFSTLTLIVWAICIAAPRADSQPSTHNLRLREQAESVVVYQDWIYVTTVDQRILRCRVDDVVWEEVQFPIWPAQMTAWRLSGGSMVAWALDLEGGTQIVVFP